MGPDPEVDYPVVFFDGVCNLCNRSVDFIIRHDPKGKFRFASLQSEYAEKIMFKLGEKIASQPESIILLDEGTIFRESTAALKIVRKLDGALYLLYYLIYIPHWLRDRVYRWIARNRYGLFGRRESCRIPDPSIKNRFIDQPY